MGQYLGLVEGGYPLGDVGSQYTWRGRQVL